mmetsp:Transcript_32201/g.79747  ORF Transcript_32201/g.79747 Transcript_32201/m.79747 type:complete len:232 (+) Transcript_32201:766-1461(+)
MQLLRSLLRPLLQHLDVREVVGEIVQPRDRPLLLKGILDQLVHGVEHRTASCWLLRARRLGAQLQLQARVDADDLAPERDRLELVEVDQPVAVLVEQLHRLLQGGVIDLPPCRRIRRLQLLWTERAVAVHVELLEHVFERLVHQLHHSILQIGRLPSRLLLQVPRRIEHLLEPAQATHVQLGVDDLPRHVVDGVEHRGHTRRHGGAGGSEGMYGDRRRSPLKMASGHATPK